MTTHLLKSNYVEVMVLGTKLDSGHSVSVDQKSNAKFDRVIHFTLNTFNVQALKTRLVRRQRSSPERGNPIWKSLNIIDEMHNLNIAVNDRVRPDFDVGKMREGHMPLKRLHLGRCGRNTKAISYMLNPILGRCGRNMKAISYILQPSCTLFKT